MYSASWYIPIQLFVLCADMHFYSYLFTYIIFGHYYFNVIGLYCTTDVVWTIITLLAVTCNTFLQKLPFIISDSLLYVEGALNIVLNWRPNAYQEHDYKFLPCFILVTLICLLLMYIFSITTWMLSDRFSWVVAILQVLIIWQLKCLCNDALVR